MVSRAERHQSLAAAVTALIVVLVISLVLDRADIDLMPWWALVSIVIVMVAYELPMMLKRHRKP